jgi:hypothetical protein
MTGPDDEVFAITSAGGVSRTAAAEVKLSGRQTMGVRLMNLAPGDSLVAIARNAEPFGGDVGTGGAGLPDGAADDGPEAAVGTGPEDAEPGPGDSAPTDDGAPGEPTQ